ncbi:MAG: hypothetical protein ACXWIN_04000 [Burkholderiaceae bacterium]
MNKHIYIPSDVRMRSMDSESLEVSTLQQNQFDSIDMLDGSIAGLNRFLQELVEITGQHDGAHSVPVLVLQFGDIVTTTSLSTAKGAEYLSITAVLPRLEQSDCLPPASVQSALSCGDNDAWESLWHADEGRYVVVRKIPIGDLPDEPSVMDAIMETSDHVAIWFAGICAGALLS